MKRQKHAAHFHQPRAHNIKPTRPARWPRLLGLFVLFVLLSGCLPIYALYLYAFSIPLPADPVLASTSTVTDVAGRQIGELNTSGQKLIEPNHLPENLSHAVLAAEDHNFYQHDAVSWLSLISSTIGNLSNSGIARGGSTITQQYVKNAYLHDQSRNFGRKLKESAMGIKLERTLQQNLGSKTAAKNHILANYLNTIYYGHGLIGADAASHYYFGKSPNQLTPAEAATIAGTIRAPNTYQARTLNFPPGKTLAAATEYAQNDPQHGYDTILRRNEVLSAMAKNNWLPPSANLTNLELSPLGFTPTLMASASDGGNVCLLEKVRETVRNELGDAAITRLGLHVQLTIDVLQQQAARAAANSHRPTPTALVGLVAVDPQNGAVRAIYDNCDFDQQFNIAIDAQRQIASTIKPFIVAASLSSGTPLPSGNDVPACFTTSGATICNDDRKPRTKLSLAAAMAQSNNPYWVSLATSTIGLESVRFALASQGAGSGDIPSAAPPDCPLVPALSIGACERSVLDLASAYGTWANRGIHAVPYLVSRISVQATDQTLYQHTAASEITLAPKQADFINALLTGVIDRPDGTAHATAQIGRPAAGKTGTSSNNADAWFVGYTPSPRPGSGAASKALSTAVWVGYDDHHALTVTGDGDSAGGAIAAPIWRDFMTSALAGQPPVNFQTAVPDPETGQ